MGRIRFLLLFCLCYYQTASSQTMASKKISYLALGDSYTIGESVPALENFPHQTVQLLTQKGFTVQSPTIIAKTGWTTDELNDGISNAGLDKEYDFVSLLIGVNNQYRGKSKDEYAEQFAQLLKKSIRLAANNPSHVIVVSIPDWGATPFAEGRDRNKIAQEIDAFNAINKRIALTNNVHYIDITPGSREASFDETLLANDKLHPSAKEYKRWAVKVGEVIEDLIKLQEKK